MSSARPAPSPWSSRAEILKRARDLGFPLKIHADEFDNLGGASLAAELGAVSADHLVKTSAEDIRALASSNTVAVGLPCTPFGLAEREYTPAQAILEAGGLLAIATDLNPGTAWCENMQFAMALACRYMRLTPAQAIAAATINAAAAIGRARSHRFAGAGQAGRPADPVRPRLPPPGLPLWHQPGADGDQERAHLPGLAACQPSSRPETGTQTTIRCMVLTMCCASTSWPSAWPRRKAPTWKLCALRHCCTTPGMAWPAEAGDHALRQGHHHASADFAARVLAAEGWTRERISAVQHCIRSHRFRDDSELPQTLEARVLFDADKLDAIGAIGVARALAFAVRRGQPVYAPPSEQFLHTGKTQPGEPHSAYHEYRFKLVKLKDRLFTPAARIIAEQRHQQMVDFFERLADEAEGYPAT